MIMKNERKLFDKLVEDFSYQTLSLAQRKVMNDLRFWRDFSVKKKEPTSKPTP